MDSSKTGHCSSSWETIGQTRKLHRTDQKEKMLTEVLVVGHVFSVEFL